MEYSYFGDGTSLHSDKPGPMSNHCNAELYCQLDLKDKSQWNFNQSKICLQRKLTKNGAC